MILFPNNSAVRRIRNLIYDEKFRAVASQILLVVFVNLIIVFAVFNAFSNLESQNKNFGFDFLNHTAGFKLSFSLVGHNEDITYGGIFVISLLNTILVAIFGIFFATILGVIIGIARLSKNWMIAKAALSYVEVVRNIPLLLHIFFWYFAVFSLLPSLRNSISIFDYIYINKRGVELPRPVFEDGSIYVLLAVVIAIVLSVVISIWARKRQRITGETFPSFWSGLAMIVFLPLIVYFLAGSPIELVQPELKGFNFKGGIKIVRSLFALTLALSTYTASYIAEIVRSGILAVNYGQTEASYSLGLTKTRTLYSVILPQALRVIIPPLTNQYLNLTKNSSLATAIAYQDLVAAFAGTVLNQTGRAIEIILMTMLVYLSLSLLTSALMNIYNRKIAIVER